jgi:CHAT domain-containing protein
MPIHWCLLYTIPAADCVTSVRVFQSLPRRCSRLRPGGLADAEAETFSLRECIALPANTSRHSTPLWTHLSAVPRARFPGAARACRAATVSAIQQHGAGARLFHFAGHGSGAVGPAGLSLYDFDLDASRIMRMDWSGCGLVVLSACLTAESGFDAQAGPESLVRAFLLGGARCVVAPRWRVSSSATREFMRVFYRGLVNGASVPAALRLVRRSLGTNPSFCHPYFWAAFQVYQ